MSGRLLTLVIRSEEAKLILQVVGIQGPSRRSVTTLPRALARPNSVSRPASSAMRCAVSTRGHSRSQRFATKQKRTGRLA